MQHKEEFYLLLRLSFALLTGMHGAQKAFLMWDFPADQELSPLVDVAGWVEAISALMIAAGLLVRLAAGAMVILLPVAYFVVHFERGLWAHHYHPEEGFTTLHHGGEVVMLHFLIACVILVLGGRKWSLERLIFKKELL